MLIVGAYGYVDALPRKCVIASPSQDLTRLSNVKTHTQKKKGRKPRSTMSQFALGCLFVHKLFSWASMVSTSHLRRRWLLRNGTCLCAPLLISCCFLSWPVHWPLDQMCLQIGLTSNVITWIKHLRQHPPGVACGCVCLCVHAYIYIYICMWRVCVCRGGKRWGKAFVGVFPFVHVHVFLLRWHGSHSMLCLSSRVQVTSHEQVR